MRTALLVVAGWLTMAGLAWGQPALTMPEGGVSILPEGGVEVMRLGERTDAKVELVSVADQSGKVLRLRTIQRPDNPYNIQAQARSIVALKRGDACLITFMARAVETSDEMGEATLGVVFEHAGPPHTKSLHKALKLNTQWRRFFLPFAMETDEGAGEAILNLMIGYLPQVVEVADLKLVTYGRTRDVRDLPMQGAEVRYRGREADAPWRKAAEERIEQHRKAPLKVVVKDSAGRPVADAEVRVQMARHAYHFGSAVTAQMLTADSDDGRAFRKIVEDNFNAVVLENDLKFNPWMNGKTSARTAAYNNENTIEALKWLKGRGIFVRGHCLLWGPLDKRFYPESRGFDFDAADPKKNRVIVEAYIDDILKQTDGLIDEWDVVNHPIATWGDRGRCWSDLFGREFYAELFHRARAANPKMRRFINEGGDIPGSSERARKDYEDVIAWLLEQKAPVDGIGFMGHFGAASLASMDYVYEHFERYGKFGLPMRVTELDISTDGDEAVQADYMRDFLTMVFSHPQSDGIIMWGFWERRHWKPETALWRGNWEIKPVGQAWLDLVKKKWWTDETGKTNGEGQMSVRGFLGEYVVEVTAGGSRQRATVSLDKDGAQCVVQLR